MEPNIQETLNPDINDIEKMFQHLSITNSSEFLFDEDDDNNVVDEEEEEEEFSFMSVGADTSPAFMDGEIKPIFPLFNMELTLSSQDFPMQPHVKNVFVEMESVTSPTTSKSDEISGPCCYLLNRKMVEVDACKKSNSTGFSKIWRFKDLIGRSNSDGRDAFVFLNNCQPSHKVVLKEDKAKVASENMKKATSSSSHEVYLKRRAKDEERRRTSYLPYKPELMGFFTNVNGGLTRNLHPY